MSRSREEAVALDVFANDDMEPLEEIYFALRNDGIAPSPDRLLTLIFGMVQEGLVDVRQIPILGQTFAERAITPTNTAEIVGDLSLEFAEFCSRGDYLNRLRGSGVPFGIYLVLTESGRKHMKEADPGGSSG